MTASGAARRLPGDVAGRARRLRRRALTDATDRYQRAVATRSRSLPVFLAAAAGYDGLTRLRHAARRGSASAVDTAPAAAATAVEPGVRLVPPSVELGVATVLLRWPAAEGRAHAVPADAGSQASGRRFDAAPGEVRLGPHDLPDGRWHLALDGGALLGFGRSHFPALAGIPSPGDLHDGGARLELDCDDANRLVLRVRRPQPA